MPTLQEQVNAAASGAVIQHDVEFVGNLVVDKAISIQGSGTIRTPSVEPAVNIPPKTGPVILKGLKICTSPDVPMVYTILNCGSWQTSVLADVPQGLVIDSCEIFGQPNQDIQQGVIADAANVVIQNSKIREIHHSGADAQAILVRNGPGPFRILDNYLEASGENILFGGADARIPDLVPSDIEIRRNLITAPLSWNVYGLDFVPIFGQAVTWTTDPAPGPNEPSTDHYRPRWIDAQGNTAKHYKNKNRLELKNARHVLIDGNTFQNSWGDAQIGFGVLFTVRNQDGTNPWAVVEDITFTNNSLLNVAGGFQLLGLDYIHPSQQCARLRIANNLIKLAQNDALGPNGRLLQLQQFNQVTFENNEADPPHSIANLTGQDASGMPLTVSGFIYRNNLVSYGQYGLFADGDKPFTVYAPDGIVTNNYIYGPSIPAIKKLPGNFYSDAKPNTLPAGIGADTAALLAAQTKPIATPPVVPPVTSTPAPIPIPTPIKYVYDSRPWPTSGTARLKLLNDMGALSWRLSQVVSSTVYFEKRVDF